MDFRKNNFQEIEKVFTEEQAMQEAKWYLKYDVALKRESKEQYDKIWKGQIDFRHLDGSHF